MVDFHFARIPRRRTRAMDRDIMRIARSHEVVLRSPFSMRFTITRSKLESARLLLQHNGVRGGWWESRVLCLRLLGALDGIGRVTATWTSESRSERRSRPQNWSMAIVTCGGRRTSSRTDGCQCTGRCETCSSTRPTEAHCATPGAIIELA
jgi:hypothetical protein